MDEPPWEWGEAGPPPPHPHVPQLVRDLLHEVEVELSLYVAAAALLYAFLLVFLNTESSRIVEKNPRKFKIDGGELTARRTFIEHTKDEVKVGHAAPIRRDVSGRCGCERERGCLCRSEGVYVCVFACARFVSCSCECVCVRACLCVSVYVHVFFFVCACLYA